MNIGERMIAERQREIAVSLKALHMMQEHHGNRYLSFKCVPETEERQWYAKAEKLIPPVGDYDATDDFAKSIDEAYRVIRERKAAGGKGWEPP